MFFTTNITSQTHIYEYKSGGCTLNQAYLRRASRFRTISRDSLIFHFVWFNPSGGVGSAHIHPEILPAGAERAEKLLVPRNIHSESANEMTGFCVFFLRQHYIYAAAGWACKICGNAHVYTYAPAATIYRRLWWFIRQKNARVQSKVK
jgi:hypothetical protein